MKLTWDTFLRVFIFIVIFTILFPSSITAQDSSHKEIDDQKYHFSLKVPSKWSLETIKNPDSYQRLLATDPNQDYILTVYALKHSNRIDLEKLSDIDRDIFTNLGQEIKKEQIKKYLFYTYAIEKRYGKNNDGLYAFSHFEVSGQYGYMIFAFSNKNDFSNIKEIINSFDSEVPLLERVLARFSSPVIWISGILVGLIIIGLTYLLARTGYLFRKGVMLKQELNKKEYRILKKDEKMKKVWIKNNNRALRLIVLPVLGWIALFFLLWYFIPHDLFKVTPILLLFPVLGYFGGFPVPSKNPFDYLP